VRLVVGALASSVVGVGVLAWCAHPSCLVLGDVGVPVALELGSEALVFSGMILLSILLSGVLRHEGGLDLEAGNALSLRGIAARADVLVLRSRPFFMPIKSLRLRSELLMLQ